MRNSYWITAAAISPDATKMAICSQDRVWIFSNFTGDKFFGGDTEEIYLGAQTQREAICFINNHELYLTDEGNRILYHLDINKSTSGGLINGFFEELTGWNLWASTMTSDCSMNGNKGLKLSSNEAGAEQIVLGLKENTDYTLSTFINSNNSDVVLGVKDYNGSDKSETTCNSNSFEQFSLEFNTGNQSFATVFLYRYGNTTTVCADDFVLEENSIVNGISDNHQSPEITLILYPNPTHNGKITLVLPETFQSASLKIYDVFGKKVHHQLISSNTNEVMLNLDLSQGVYIIQVLNNNVEYSSKLIVD